MANGEYNGPLLYLLLLFSRNEISLETIFAFTKTSVQSFINVVKYSKKISIELFTD